MDYNLMALSPKNSDLIRSPLPTWSTVIAKKNICIYLKTRPKAAHTKVGQKWNLKWNELRSHINLLAFWTWSEAFSNYLICSISDFVSSCELKGSRTWSTEVQKFPLSGQVTHPLFKERKKYIFCLIFLLFCYLLGNLMMTLGKRDEGTRFIFFFLQSVYL